MAKMIPSTGPREFHSLSREDVIYHALASLPDDFYVVHSLRMVTAQNDTVQDNEADFVVFCQELGILCIEAKSGKISYRDGSWFYASGRKMKHGGPFNQASNAVYRLLDTFEEARISDVARRCKILHAVWFPSIARVDFLRANTPPEAQARLTLFKDDLLDPEPTIRRIFSLEVGNQKKETLLNDKDSDAIVRCVLCPSFDLIPSKRYRYDLEDIAFIRLLDSQQRVLNYIVDQQSAVINGPAGSGKTLIAMERARRAAKDGARVLFLCYNSLLQHELKDRLADIESIDVYTIAGFACRECNTSEPDYELLGEKLLAYSVHGGFPYRHVIIDEGQDFGISDIENAGVLTFLRELSQQADGTFYLFYDKNQLVQGSGLPAFLSEADCKLSLYVNCRNTKNIALSSIGALADPVKCKTTEAAVAGQMPKIHIAHDAEETAQIIDGEIQELKSRGIEDIVILTCKTPQRSRVSQFVQGDRWKAGRTPFYTCRRFKGLEADGVILIDVDETLWRDEGEGLPYDAKKGLMYYTGASRAKHELRVIFDIDEEGCLAILEKLGEQARRRPLQALARRFNAFIS